MHRAFGLSQNRFGLALDIYIYTEPNLYMCWAKEKCPYQFFFSPAHIPTPTLPPKEEK
jgi:hypothetical protein